MIDLHNHIFFGLDDGSPSLSVSLEMARLAVDDGITHIAGTPHITAGIYDNDRAGIVRAMDLLAQRLRESGIGLALSMGADIHVCPDLLHRLSSRSAPTLNDSRYFLLEPPRHVPPPGLAQLVRESSRRGYVPIITHPERLAWIDENYGAICELQSSGALLQLTAGSITGTFGKRAQYWSERIIDEGRAAVIATDAHNTTKRPPLLSRARDVVAARWGEALASDLTLEHPRAILSDQDIEVAPVGHSEIDARNAGFGAAGDERSGWKRVKRLLKLKV